MHVVYPYAKPGRGFAYPEYGAVYPPSIDAKVRHYLLDIHVWPEERRLEGEAEIHLEAPRAPVWVRLDACELEVESVSLDGGEARWSYDGARVSVRLEGERGVVKVRYRARPRKGFHFILPSGAHPERRPQAWSQGETEYNRYWMPIIDHPSVKHTSEVIARVPRGYRAISNGELLGVREEGGLSVWHWRMNRPHAPYLISLVVGVFEEIVEEAGGVRLEYYVPPGWRDKAHLSFAKTPRILEFFSRYLDYPYPYTRYAQVAIYEALFMGMENTTATTLSENTLHDEKAHMDFSSDELVSHEAAHQWFGDLVTCRDWPHIWINESMATLLANLFTRHDKGEDEFIYELIRDMDAYLLEYRDAYARPIVTRVYRYPSELFDSHAYPKGGLILNTLRNYIGEEAFRKGLSLFLRRFADSVAETDDFRRAMEDASGRNLELFFEQFFMNAGHPAIRVEERWDEERGILTLRIGQTQGDDSLSVYVLPLRIVIKTDAGEEVHQVELKEREEAYSFRLPRRPELVCVDPYFEVFKTLEYQRTAEQWLRVLRSDPHVYCRVLAARALGRLGGAAAVDGLAEAVVGDAFWGVGAEAAKALGEARTEQARDALLRCLGEVTHPKVRRAVCEALGNYRGRFVAEALRSVLLNSDESYYVRQAAAISLGKTREEWAREVLMSVIDAPSHNYAVTTGVLRGLGELGGDESMKVIINYAGPGRPSLVRSAAITTLGKFPGRREVHDLLAEYAADENYRVRRAVVAACRELLAPEVLPILERMSMDVYEMIRRAARDAAEKIRRHMEKGTEYKALREEIEKIREENSRLLERIALIAKGAEMKG